MLMCHHKAPHRPWVTDDAHASMFLNEDLPEPDTLQDDYSERAAAAAAAQMRVGVHMNDTDLKAEMPRDMPEAELRSWAYQRYIKDYLRVVASIDDNVGRLLDWLDEQGLAEDTVVVYTSDQGFFLGDHGWYDKRFMYEESLRMPLVMRCPRRIEAGGVSADMVLNVDFAPTFLELAGLEPDAGIQGRSFAAHPGGRHAAGLAPVLLLSLLDAPLAPQRLRPLRRSHASPQADLLLRRRARSLRQRRRAPRSRMGALRPAG